MESRIILLEQTRKKMNEVLALSYPCLITEINQTYYLISFPEDTKEELTKERLNRYCEILKQYHLSVSAYCPEPLDIENEVEGTERYLILKEKIEDILAKLNLRFSFEIDQPSDMPSQGLLGFYVASIVIDNTIERLQAQLALWSPFFNLGQSYYDSSLPLFRRAPHASPEEMKDEEKLAPKFSSLSLD